MVISNTLSKCFVPHNNIIKVLQLFYNSIAIIQFIMNANLTVWNNQIFQKGLTLNIN